MMAVLVCSPGLQLLVCSCPGLQFWFALDALEAATIRPTEFLGLADKMGTVEVGKRADLVLLSENPLEDIRNTRQINTVISKGKVVSH